MDALKMLPAGAPPIPPANHGGQALLETQILEKMRGLLGLCSPHPLGIRSVTPTPDTLTIVLDREPFVVRAWAQQLLPIDPGDGGEIWGLWGLRYRIARHRIYLIVDDGTHRAQVALAGFPVRWWEKSVLALLASPYGTACWLQRAGQMTDGERDLHEWAAALTARDNHLGSGLLRRIGLTRFNDGYGGTEVWSHPAGPGAWEWRLELLSGPDDTWLLDQLCDPDFGLPLQVDRHRCWCGTDMGGCTATLSGTGTPPQTLYFSDLRWTADSDEREKRGERRDDYNRRAFTPDE
ncbi:hypothetical protein ABZ616_20440 [Streptomyces noursei]|uniref:hypothetical protein n=1 Tax=Streptomyces noursei TaxID=1971 RepID=UPI0033E54850